MNEDDPLRGTLAALTTQIQQEVARRVETLSGEVAAAERRGMEAGRQQAIDAARLQSADAAKRLLDAVVALDEAAAAGSLTRVLDKLLSGATKDAPEAILFVARDQTLHAWNLGVTIQSVGLLAEALRSGTLVNVPVEGRAPEFVSLAGARPAIAIPIVVGGEAVAILFADGGRDVSPNAGSIGIEPDWQTPLQVLARHAGRCLESVTALRAAGLVASQTAWLHEPIADPSEPAAREQDDQLAHQAAHRYARLLISEIKLYHGDAIAAGRRERDLLSRLGGEIARAQALYDERVPEPIRRSTDFFRAEVVKTLAGGDEALIEHRR